MGKYKVSYFKVFHFLVASVIILECMVFDMFPERGKDRFIPIILVLASVFDIAFVIDKLKKYSTGLSAILYGILKTIIVGNLTYEWIASSRQGTGVVGRKSYSNLSNFSTDVWVNRVGIVYLLCCVILMCRYSLKKHVTQVDYPIPSMTISNTQKNKKALLIRNF